MDRRILVVGSIIAAVILVLVSFNSVVGFQSVKSDYVKASPLFNVRTNRAIDEEKNAPIFYYIRKEKGITIPLLTKDEETVLLHKFIDKIKNIDNLLEKKQAIRYIISNFLKNENYNVDQKDITSRCGPTLGLNIFNCPIKFTIRYGIEFAGLGCLQFLAVVIAIFFVLFLLYLGGWTSDNGHTCYEYCTELCLI